MDEIDALRAFNRFHTRWVGALDDSHLGSGLTLTQARVLYEIASGADRGVALGAALGMDPGQVSRNVSALRRRRLVEGERTLSLTAAGEAAFAGLRQATRERLRGAVAPLGKAGRAELVRAARAVQAALGGAAGAERLRDPRPGDLGRILARQVSLYAEEFGWGGRFEALVARILADYAERAAKGEPGQRAWIAERGGAIAGSVLVMRDTKRTARLRLLYVEPWARRSGLGRRLTRAAIAFAREAGYGKLALWTNDPLKGARAIYDAEGFVQTGERAHDDFGKRLVGQEMVLKL